uniref:Probable ATP-dependent transporter ycf16 n=1 Tax=Helminthora furcellata TaxID=1884666 RepID=A0A1G4NZD0_9FLOR|nr:Iron-sulfur cluster formation ABC transporter ATP-binding subunit [Helminthora furcellata]SCW21132.1 Iron-sulfur cluster formation ABC transporter ATP-binding subunit [Helminthora furcellata]SCW23992.1 Iron-sulfur cluster formation ABC transporter ATP-binding subunit [Helminthora furcellata]
MSEELISIKNLYVQVNNVQILCGLNLTINKGEIHAIMGPNGSGKSTLAKVISGHPGYEITNGSIVLNGVNITDIDPEVRAHMGIFLAFQYPIEIPGVSNTDFLRLAYNCKRKANNLPELDPLSFFQLVSDKLDIINMDAKFLGRNVNEGFSGGEKKKNEILQMALLEPVVSILDETDSGLDIDALRIIANGINDLFSNKQSIILITHYQRLLDYITPDFVHIMHEGQIKYTGDATLAYELEKNGYDILKIKAPSS